MNDWTETRSRRRRATGKGSEPSPGEVRRFIQLGVCIAIFLMVFIGRGVFPDGMETLREDILHVIQTGTDFKAVFSELGASIRAGEPVTAVIGNFWWSMAGAPGAATPAVEGPAVLTPPEGAPPTDAEQPAAASPAEPVSEPNAEPSPESTAEPTAESTEMPPPEPSPEVTPQPSPEPSAAASAQSPAVSSRALPANATVDYVALPLDKIVTPVSGVVSSAYGYRNHPIDGEEKFHYGIDIFTEKGTPVLSFAEGVVDYIGESPVYGLYIQIRHPNNVTSFYAHCDTLLLRQGKAVAAGQQIATVGESGNATGPHLHLEIKHDNVFCDPAFYLDLQ